MNLVHTPFAVVIKPIDTEIQLFVSQLSGQLAPLTIHNIVIDLTFFEQITLDDIKLFAELSKTHKKLKKSFVIVVNGINFNKISTKMTVVPTLQEAQDMIEIENIERDLGI